MENIEISITTMENHLIANYHSHTESFRNKQGTNK